MSNKLVPISRRKLRRLGDLGFEGPSKVRAMIYDSRYDSDHHTQCAQRQRYRGSPHDAGFERSENR